MRKLLLQAVLISACVLSACSSAPTAHGYNPDKDPYWEDPKWQAALLNTVQSVVHAPADTPDLSAPGYHVTVQFSFHDGDIEGPQIVESTGHPDLDQLVLQQVVTAVVPKPTGFDAAEPHPFALELDVPTPLESFESGVFAAIDAWKVYPKDSIMHGSTGNTTVDFDYMDGKVRNVSVIRTSKDRDMDGASVSAVARAVMPSTPPAYAGKTLHMEVIVCYSLIQSQTEVVNPCPAGRNVVQVTGTRIRRVTIETSKVN